MKRILRFFFYLLYHPFAFAYDLVAATVSFGRWNDWVLEVVPFIEGRRILEIGNGPGHLQRVLLSRGLVAVGLDESPQMGQLAKRRIDGKFPSTGNVRSQSLANYLMHESGYTQSRITRGLAQCLPFLDATFDTVVATFPSEYIFNPSTLTEAHRVLTENGRFVILPGALITGHGVWDRFLAWLFRFTGQTPPNLSEIVHEKTREPFANAGFQVEVHELDGKSSIVFIVVAIKMNPR